MAERIEQVLADVISVSSEIRIRTAALARMERRLAQCDEPLLRDALDTARRELSQLHQLKAELTRRLQALENGSVHRAAINRPTPLP